MRYPKWILVGVGILLLTTAIYFAAGGSHLVRSAPAPQEDAGEATAQSFARGGCAACHTIPGVPNAVGLVGPDLSAIGAEGEGRVTGLSAEEYIRQSILDPAAFIAPACPIGECPTDVMPPNLSERLVGDDLDRIVGYLLTLTGEGEFLPPAYELVPIEIVRPPEAGVRAFADPPRSYEDAQVLLGKYLFFDPRLSGDAGISCASCHQPDNAWTDGLALSDGYPTTLYFRNTPTVLNTVYNQGFLYWDGRMDATDMPTLVRDHLTEAHFMNTDGRLMTERVKQVPEYVQLFQDAYSGGPSFGRILNGLTAYVHSLNSPASPYDTGDLSPEAQAGQELFEGRAGCITCHSGETFSDGAFYALGVPDNPDVWQDPLRHITFRRFMRLFGVSEYRTLDTDPGLAALTGMAQDRGAFRSAPLRELVHTAPYMHNGVFGTLTEVVQFYDQSMGLDLSGEEIEQIVAFLESLSSDLPEIQAPVLPEYQLRTLGDNR